MATAAEIAEALSGQRAPTSLSFVFEKRDHDYGFQVDVSNAIIGGSITLDNDRQVLRQGTLTIDPSLAELDPNTDHIAISMRLRIGTELVTIPLGFFHMNVPRRAYKPNGDVIWEVEISDLTIHLLESTTDGPYTIASGEEYLLGTNGVKDILDRLNLNYSLPIDAAAIG